MNVYGDSCSQVLHSEGGKLTADPERFGIRSQLLFLVAQQEIPFQEASKEKTSLTHQIIVCVVGIPG